MRRAGLTLLELTVAAALASLVVGMGLLMLVSMQEQAVESALMRDVTAESRRLAGIVAAEVADLNLTAQDLEPDAPLDDTGIAYRKLIGYDPATREALLSPDRASGDFHRVSLIGQQIQLAPAYGSPVVLGERVTDLRFTLDPPGDRLRVRVIVQRQGPRGKPVRGVHELTVLLRNKAASAR